MQENLIKTVLQGLHRTLCLFTFISDSQHAETSYKIQNIFHKHIIPHLSKDCKWVSKVNPKAKVMRHLKVDQVKKMDLCGLSLRYLFHCKRLEVLKM